MHPTSNLCISMANALCVHHVCMSYGMVNKAIYGCCARNSPPLAEHVLGVCARMWGACTLGCIYTYIYDSTQVYGGYHLVYMLSACPWAQWGKPCMAAVPEIAFQSRTCPTLACNTHGGCGRYHRGVHVARATHTWAHVIPLVIGVMHVLEHTEVSYL